MLQDLYIVLLGLAVGSFISAYTFRKPKGLSVIFGRSFCPHCKAKIAWYDNVPLLSYVLLGAKCRSCGKKISLRYPLIEAATGAIFLYLSLRFNLPILFYLLPIVGILIAIFVIDLEHKIIPDELVFLGIAWILGYYLLFTPGVIFSKFLIGFGTSLFFLLIHLLTRGRGMGLGDVKFVILGGFLLGWPLAAVWLFLSFASGAIIGVILILLKKARFGREIPFGPYLTAALLATILFGEKLISLYMLL